jgi:hypothetical protein
MAEPESFLQGHDGPAYDIKLYGEGEDALLLRYVCGHFEFQKMSILNFASYMIFLLLINYNTNMWNASPRIELHYYVMGPTVILVS